MIYSKKWRNKKKKKKTENLKVREETWRESKRAVGGTMVVWSGPINK